MLGTGEGKLRTAPRAFKGSLSLADTWVPPVGEEGGVAPMGERPGRVSRSELPAHLTKDCGVSLLAAECHVSSPCKGATRESLSF